MNSKEIRERNLGNKIYLTAHIHMITPCNLSPRCSYCSLSSKFESVRAERDVLTIDEILHYIKKVEEVKEISSIILVGGSDLRGHDRAVIDVVKMARRITDAEIAIDVGAPLKVETLETLKDYSVTVYSSIETINRKAFTDAKPGDSLDMRIDLLNVLERLNMDIGTVIMNMGNEKDVYDSIEFLKRYQHLKYLYFSTFKPVKGTPWENRRAADIENTIKFIEHARQIFPDRHIALADVEIEGGSLSPWILQELDHGAGNTLAGILLYKYKTFNYIDSMLGLEKLGYEIVRRK